MAKAPYKFGDITRWVIAWYKDHPDSIVWQFDWLKFFRTFVSTLILTGTITSGSILAALGGAFQASAHSPATWAALMAGISSVYAAGDFLYRLVYGGSIVPTPDPLPPAPAPTPLPN